MPAARVEKGDMPPAKLLIQMSQFEICEKVRERLTQSLCDQNQRKTPVHPGLEPDLDL